MTSRILGPDGRPIAKADLTREIASVSLTGVRRRYADSVAPGLTPARLASIIRAADNGDAHAYLTLAEEMEERCPQYAAVLGTRKRAVLGLPRRVEAASDDPHDVELRDAVETHLVKSPAFGRLQAPLLDALGKGYSVAEIRWDTTKTPWVPRDQDRIRRAYTWRDPRHFVYDRVTGRELRMLDDADTFNGVPLPPYRFIIHEPALKMGLPIRNGLVRLVVVAYMCGNFTQEDWLAFAEVFGMPLRLGRYGPGAGKDDIDTLIAAVSGLGSDAAAVLPDSMRIEFVNAASGAGGADLFERLADRLDKLISKAVLGRSDAADSTSGQLGGEQYASEVRRDILEGDASELSNTLNEQLVRPFIDLNFGPQAAYPEIQLYVPDQEDLAGLAAMLEKLVPLGLEVEQSVVRDKWGLPDPAKGAKLLGVRADIPPDIPAMNRATNRAQPPPDAADPTEPLVERLGREADPLLDALLEPVRAALTDSADLMDFRERLLGLYPELDGKAFAELMGQALAVADAAGYWEAT